MRKSFGVLSIGLVMTVSMILGLSESCFAATLGEGVYLKIYHDKVDLEPRYTKFHSATNENCWVPNESLMEQFVYMEASAVGVSLVRINKAGQETCYGPASSFQLVDAKLYTEPTPQADFSRGEFVVSQKSFVISQSGLFHVALDMSTRWITMLPIKSWNIVGTATPYGWKPVNPIMLGPTFSADHQSGQFVADSVKLTKGWYKFRYSDGWKITIDTLASNDCWNKGSKVNTNFGGTLDSLVLGGGNIPSLFHGIYKVTLNWAQGENIKASVVKVADIPEIDFSAYSIGIIGDAYLAEDGLRANWVDNWKVATETKFPTKVDDTYSWTFSNIPLIDGGEFKLRQGNQWRGMSIDCGDIGAWKGNAKDDLVNMDGKFHVSNRDGRPYTIILSIDGKTGNLSLEISK